MTMNFYELLDQRDNGDAAISAIETGFPVNQHFSDGLTPLIIASMWGQERVVDSLIANKANVNLAAKSAEHQMPLHVASQSGWKDICQTLVEAGASVSDTDGTKSTPLHHAAGMGFLEICRYLVDKGAKTNAKNKFKGATPLQIAVANGAQGIGAFEIQLFESELVREGIQFPKREPQNHVATVSFLLRLGVSRSELSKAAKWARIYGSDKMIQALTFHGSK